MGGTLSALQRAIPHTIAETQSKARLMRYRIDLSPGQRLKMHLEATDQK